MDADKRIPVTEETWETLGDMKSAGQTYDELVRELIQAYNRQELLKNRDEQEFVPLEEAGQSEQGGE